MKVKTKTRDKIATRFTRSKKKGEAKAETKDIGIWLVEKVVKKRVRNGNLQYLVKWQNFPSSANTWEPIEHLCTCTQLVADFEAKSNKRNKRKTAGLTSALSTSSSRQLPAPVVGDNEVTVGQSSNFNDAYKCQLFSPGAASPTILPTTPGIAAIITTVPYEHNPSSIVPVNVEGDQIQTQIPAYTSWMYAIRDFDWDHNPVKAVVGVDRIKTSRELFYKVAWDRFLSDEGDEGKFVTQIDLVPAVSVREKVPHLVIEYLQSIVNWVITPPISPNSSFSEYERETENSGSWILQSASDEEDEEGVFEDDSTLNVARVQNNFELEDVNVDQICMQSDEVIPKETFSVSDKNISMQLMNLDNETCAQLATSSVGDENNLNTKEDQGHNVMDVDIHMLNSSESAV